MTETVLLHVKLPNADQFLSTIDNETGYVCFSVYDGPYEKEWWGCLLKPNNPSDKINQSTLVNVCPFGQGNQLESVMPYSKFIDGFYERIALVNYPLYMEIALEFQAKQAHKKTQAFVEAIQVDTINLNTIEPTQEAPATKTAGSSLASYAFDLPDFETKPQAKQKKLKPHQIRALENKAKEEARQKRINKCP